MELSSVCGVGQGQQLQECNPASCSQSVAGRPVLLGSLAVPLPVLWWSGLQAQLQAGRVPFSVSREPPMCSLLSLSGTSHAGSRGSPSVGGTGEGLRRGHVCRGHGAPGAIASGPAGWALQGAHERQRCVSGCVLGDAAPNCGLGSIFGPGVSITEGRGRVRWPRCASLRTAL